MGLLDVINGMQNGPRGQPAPGKSNDGMSIMTKAILALLAYKAVKHLGGDQPGAHPAGSGSAAPTQLPGNIAECRTSRWRAWRSAQGWPWRFACGRGRWNCSQQWPRRSSQAISTKRSHRGCQFVGEQRP